MKSSRNSRLFAVSDLHCNRPATWDYIKALPSHQDDWIVIAGDVCDGWTEDRFVDCLQLFKHRFAKVFWAPGNHELYTLNGATDKYKSLRGEFKYDHLVQLCNNVGVITPEDTPEKWTAKRGRPDRQFVSPSSAIANSRSEMEGSSVDEDAAPLYVCPIFTLYDYSFKPDYVNDGEELKWAQSASVHCTDEIALFNDPYPSREEWCKVRVDKTARKLNKLTEDGSHTILASHFPLRYDTVVCPYVPNFSIWCGTKQTEDWHIKYNAEAVIYGHTHNRGTIMVDNVQFHEVSLGYPQQYQSSSKLAYYLVQILPHRTSIEGCFII